MTKFKKNFCFTVRLKDIAYLSLLDEDLDVPIIVPGYDDISGEGYAGSPLPSCSHQVATPLLL